MVAPNRDATPEGLQARADMQALVHGVAAVITTVLILFAPDKFLSSTAWEYILEHLPGGYPVLVCWLAVAAVGMAAAMTRRYPYCVAAYLCGGAWYMWVAVFQVICALSETGGPLGFMGWGPYGLIVIIYGLGQTKALR